MLLRLISTLLLMLFLAGCATTGKGTADTAQIDPDPTVEGDAIPSSTATIDEHLFVPDSEPLPVDAAHVHNSTWERLVHNFSLPEWR